MKKRVLLFAGLFVTIHLAFGQVPKYVNDQLFFKLRDNYSKTFPLFSDRDRNMRQIEGVDDEILSVLKIFDAYTVLENIKASRLPSPQLQRVYRIRVKDTTLLIKLLNDLNSLPFVEYVERVPIYEIFYTSNDLNTNQWNITKTKVPQAWDLSKGTSTVVIAIVDDAVKLDHEDLLANIWVNPEEIAGNNLDDDGNGYIDDINGYDVADNDNNPTTPNSASNSVFTHGTHCAGIANARTDNGKGISSPGFSCKIMAVKTKRSTDLGSSLPFAYEGLQYAISAGANIISMSWGGYAYSNFFQQLINYANANGIILVAAAGNSNTSLPVYPASYNHVISVGATDVNDQRAYFSNYGSTIDIMAPGVNIWSTLAGSTSSYGYLSGTSMACPLVAGICGLMLSYAPDASPQLIESCLKSTADNIDSQNSGYVGLLGAGRVNAAAAMACLKGIPLADFFGTTTSICIGQSVNFYDQSVGLGITQWNWTFNGGTPSISSARNPIVTFPSSGVYPVSLKVTNGAGSNTNTKASYISVFQPSASISGNATITAGQSSPLRFDFVGAPPFSVSYTDGTSPVSVGNISSNLYYAYVSPLATKTYTISSFSDKNCSGSKNGSSIITVSATTTPCTTCNGISGLVASYPFCGNANDVSGNGYNGTVVGANLTIDRFGNSNSAYYFNGAAKINTNFQGVLGTTPRSISAWVKLETDLNCYAFSYGAGYNGLPNQYGGNFNCGFGWGQNFQNSIGSKTVVIEGNDVAIGYKFDSIRSGKWHHVVWTLPNQINPTFESVLMYVDGVLLTTKTNPYNVFRPLVTSSNSPLIIGNHPLAGNYGFKGSIDDIKIFNRALSDAEIQQLYQEPVACLSGPIASYPFCGNANDVSGNNYTGTIVGVTFGVDRFGNDKSSVDFKGGTDHIKIPRSISTKFSISAWFKSTKSYSNQPYWINGGSIVDAEYWGCVKDFGVSLINGGKIAFGVGDFSTCLPSSIVTLKDYNDGKWHMVTVTRNFNDGELALYVDGIFFTSIFSYINVLDSPPFIGIGRNTGDIINFATNYSFEGSIDDIRIFDRILNPSEIIQLYNEPAPCATDSLVLYYPFCGNPNDKTIFGNNGTLSGASFIRDRFGNPQNAYNFNGINSYIESPLTTSLGIGNAGTISLWAKRDNWSNLPSVDKEFINNNYPYPNSNNIYLSFHYGQGIHFRFKNGGFDYVSSTIHTSWLDNSWHHIVGKWEPIETNSMISLYADGVLLANKTVSGTINLTSSKWNLGKYLTAMHQEWFDGDLDDIRIYNKALTSKSILALFNEPAPCAICPVTAIPAIAGSISICLNGTENYNVNSILGVNYTWSVSGGNLLLSSGNSSVVKWILSGVSTLSAIPSNTCVGISKLTVTVGCCTMTPVVPDFTINTNSCTGQSFTVANLSTNTTSSSSYEWNFGIDAVPQRSSFFNPSSIYYTTPGQKTIKLKVSGLGCAQVDSISKMFFFFPLPAVDAGPDLYLCTIGGQSIGVLPIADYTYTWHPGMYVVDSTQSQTTIKQSYPATIILQASYSESNCVGYDTLHVVQLDSVFTTTFRPIVEVTCIEPTLTVTSSLPKNKYLWSTGDTAQITKPVPSGTYWVKTYNFCLEKTDTILVKVNIINNYFPNVFSPNDDGRNDKLVFQSCAFYASDVSLEIFNRWGVKVYSTSSYQQDWTAKGQADGTYYYILKNSDGSDLAKGWLEIIR